ncbi:MAG: FAD-dependent oxidoreductase [Planctomycetaceae bacterium]|nr:FAD-dependent oxidoreductase [Planctomycetaceae bacterium]
MTSPLKIVIVGGVAGGASAATRARRCNEQADIVLFEKDEHVSFANCGLPYHIGGEIAERGKLLVATRELLEKRFRLDVRTRQEVVRINRRQKTITVRRLDNGEPTEYEQPYDRLILSPGAAPFVPPMPGADAAGVFTLRNIADMDRIIAATDASADRKVVVVGGGFIGLEMVEQLHHRGFTVSLAELQPQVLPPMDPEMVVPIQDDLRARGVEVQLGDGIKQIVVNPDGTAAGVELSSGRVLSGSLIILGLGVRPNTQLAAAADLEIGRTGGIAVNEYFQTSDPDIYAVGDVCEYSYGPTGEKMRIPLAGPANRAGRLAGQHAATGTGTPAAPVFGTAIVRVFETTAAMTGLSMKAAARAGLDACFAVVVAGQHAGYFPGAQPMTLKLVFAPKTGKVLGAQAIGADGVDKRIDVIATAMAFGATVRDLAGLDLAYAPPYGSAKDPVHQVAFAACNQLDGFAELLPSHADLSGMQVVDVRTKAEVEKVPLSCCTTSVNIPVDELRDRLHELQPGVRTVVSCAVGVRGHVATRILRQSGFPDTANLSGGATVRRRAATEGNDQTQ